MKVFNFVLSVLFVFAIAGTANSQVYSTSGLVLDLALQPMENGHLHSPTNTWPALIATSGGTSPGSLNIDAISRGRTNSLQSQPRLIFGVDHLSGLGPTPLGPYGSHSQMQGQAFTGVASTSLYRTNLAAPSINPHNIFVFPSFLGIGGTGTAGNVDAIEIKSVTPSMLLYYSVPQNGMGQGADIYVDENVTSFSDKLTLYVLASEIGLTLEDDIDALTVIDRAPIGIAGREDIVLFSLVRGSHSLGAQFSAADVLISRPTSGQFFKYVDSLDIGLDPDEDNLDCMSLLRQ